MYILSHDDIVKLNEVLRRARESGVSEDLRGWSWRTPPLMPPYQERLPNYLIASRYCETGRDVYVSRVLGIRGEETEPISTGTLVHRVVYETLGAIMESGEPPGFSSLGVSEKEGLLRQVYDYTAASAMAALAEVRSRFPFMPSRDVSRIGLPFLLEFRVDGSMLGLSSSLSVDAFDYLRRIVFDLKYLRPESRPEPWRRLYVTGYALVLESIYEVPVDAGCLVYVKFREGKLMVSRDIFFISDELRREWIEERDRKLEIAAGRVDPGLPRVCYDACPYRSYCLRGRLG
ncbi:MAG: type I-A CRISPR-associated protein Cas4/Csa1 [Nitrososphaeria archaeon]